MMGRVALRLRSTRKTPPVTAPSSPVKAAFDLGALVRWLDYNDTFTAAGGNNTYLYRRGEGTDRIADTSAKVGPGGTPAPNTLKFGPGIATALDGRVIRVRGEYVPLIALRRAFCIAEETDPAQCIAVILEAEGRLPDLVFQKSFNTLAKRHHVRLWQVEVPGGTAWVGAALGNAVQN